MVAENAAGTAQIKAILGKVRDPELPMISICDLGIVRRIEEGGGQYTVVITPTFSGCPAMTMIEQNIAAALAEAGVESFRIVKELSPPWQSTDVTEAGRKLLMANGIAVACEGVRCPHCQSDNTETVSEFGATACKRFARCRCCREPFEVFK
ncbi:MAG: phenylacetate-CoA oxygenase subunit PaaJ [Gammaproteobacteria bacterium]|nr:phenylacetate-CoA oxygenase subunit PaaJ [Gammaproteobacteria bacterium]MDD9875677.1 phenylacetate-CoA oxygenase subunit PaaJ [Gammaproteobacteria bacterium]